MFLSKSFNTIVSSCAALLLTAGVALNAQVPTTQAPPQADQSKDYSDDELKKYADVSKNVSTVQQESQEKMVGAIQESGMDPQKFNEMAQSQQMQAQGGEEAQYTEEEQASFQKAMQAVMSIQQSSNEDMQNAIQEGGMDVQEYQEMAMAISQDPEMQQKVQQMME